MNIKGFFAAFGKVAAIGDDRDEVLKATGAPQAAPLSDQSMCPDEIKKLSQCLEKDGFKVVVCQKKKH